MAALSIHRLIEAHAARHGERTAILTGGERMTYRELNQCANAVARHLIAGGLRRGGHAIVSMPRGIDLAVVLLAILKAGGSYTWLDASSQRNGHPPGVSIRAGREGAEDRFLSLDVGRPLADRAQANPNLPIVTRDGDVACVLPDVDGSPAVLVPHATIASLADRGPSQAARWDGEAGGLDLWLGLMSGVTVTIEDRPARNAAA